MPRIPVHTLDDAPAAVRDTLAGLAHKTGALLNIHAEMARTASGRKAGWSEEQTIAVRAGRALVRRAAR